jgi:hypothetical protein
MPNENKLARRRKALTFSAVETDGEPSLSISAPPAPFGGFFIS